MTANASPRNSPWTQTVGTTQGRTARSRMYTTAERTTSAMSVQVCPPPMRPWLWRTDTRLSMRQLGFTPRTHSASRSVWRKTHSQSSGKWHGTKRRSQSGKSVWTTTTTIPTGQDSTGSLTGSSPLRRKQDCPLSSTTATHMGTHSLCCPVTMSAVSFTAVAVVRKWRGSTSKWDSLSPFPVR